MSLSKVIEVARAELDVCEDPAGSNLTKYGYWYGVNGVPWCVIFLCWVFDRAGERMAFFGGDKTASCSILLRWYREQGLTVPVSEVQAGDIVLLNFRGGKDPEHCGLVYEVCEAAAGTGVIRTIEGNTSPSDGSQSNGGMVCEKGRLLSQIAAVCRPQYASLSAGMPGIVPEGQYPEDLGAPAMDDITGHWAEEDIRRCIGRGLMKGYPDGSFRPDQPVTRAELAAVLQRLAEA